MTLEIAEHAIGNGRPPFVIAEAGVNHNGSVDLAVELVHAAAQAHADAVKFQTFDPESVILPNAPQAAYQRKAAGAESQLEMVRRLQLPRDAWGTIRDAAEAAGIVFLSTPFDVDSVRLLADLHVPAFKVGSGDLTNLILLRAVASYGRPILLSTGMATLGEVEAAVADLRRHGDPPLVLLQCTSAYPAAPADANLQAMATLARRFRVPVGYSDHTLGIATATAAAALGAAVVEKHLTLDRNIAGPDHQASLVPDEFGSMVNAIREAHLARGDGVKEPRATEDDVRRVARRSLVISRTVSAGAALTADDLTAMRPETGITPLRLDEIIGRRAARDLDGGMVLDESDLE
jgi:N-acetylneuraminate synthase/N,N'-diacetyllegionaminate synthase